jgi:hypothetical protein
MLITVIHNECKLRIKTTDGKSIDEIAICKKWIDPATDDLCSLFVEMLTKDEYFKLAMNRAYVERNWLTSEFKEKTKCLIFQYTQLNK